MSSDDGFWKKCEELLGASETLSLKVRVDRGEMTDLEARTHAFARSRKPLENRLKAAGVSLSSPPEPIIRNSIPKRSGMTAQELTQIENKILHDIDVCEWLKQKKGISLIDLEELFQLAQLGVATRNRGVT